MMKRVKDLKPGDTVLFRKGYSVKTVTVSKVRESIIYSYYLRDIKLANGVILRNIGNENQVIELGSNTTVYTDVQDGVESLWKILQSDNLPEDLGFIRMMEDLLKIEDKDGENTK